jgi:hypothetical protein
MTFTGKVAFIAAAGVERVSWPRIEAELADSAVASEHDLEPSPQDRRLLTIGERFGYRPAPAPHRDRTSAICCDV